MTDAFHAFEHAGWQRAASAYPDTFGQVTLQAVEPLLDAVGAGPGVRLLDIATPVTSQPQPHAEAPTQPVSTSHPRWSSTHASSTPASTFAKATR